MKDSIQPEKTLASLKKRRLGRTNVMVRPLGLGGAGFGRSSDKEAIEAIHRAIELGVDYIDTSPLYGESERRIGLALAGGLRSKVFLATKTGTGVKPKNYSADWTYRSVEKSMKLLRTDMLDLVQIHDPEDLEPALAHDGALTALKDLKEQGVIRFIGLGVRSHELLLRAILSGDFDTILTYADYNLVRQTARDNLFPEAAEQDVGVILGSPILFGLLSNRNLSENIKRKNRRPDEPEIVKIRQLRKWAAERGVKILSLALQYCLRDALIGVTLVGVRNKKQVEENVMAVLDPLGENIWEELANDFGI